MFNLPTGPDYIVLYQKNVEAVRSSEAEVRHQIRQTLIHELGHYFGMTEAQLTIRTIWVVPLDHDKDILSHGLLEALPNLIVESDITVLGRNRTLHTGTRVFQVEWSGARSNPPV